jgi:hypothetical protein
MGCGCNKKKPQQEGANKHNQVTNNQIPKMPSLTKRAFNFAKSATEYVRSGMQNVSETQYETRLKICEVCPFRKDTKCSKCGCYIEVKAKWSTSTCPDNRWPLTLANQKNK